MRSDSPASSADTATVAGLAFTRDEVRGSEPQGTEHVDQENAGDDGNAEHGEREYEVN